MDFPKYDYIKTYKGNIFSFLNKNYPEFLFFVNDKYRDIDNIREKLYLFYNGLESPKICCVCGEKSIFFGLSKGYSDYCSQECSNRSKKRIENIKKTKSERYGDENFNNPDKLKQTCLKKFGTESFTKTKEFKEKSKQTKSERYGDENFNNSEKIRQTCTQRYGVYNYSLTEEFIEKSHETKKRKYGNPKFVNTDKRKQTCLERYGVGSFTQTQEFKDKSKQTCLEKYGIDAYQKTKEFSEIIRSKLDIIQQKIYQTKKQNKTFNSSSIEKQFEAYLKENNINYKTQYKSELYPFNCDFYFPDNDLYLEINAHWTHGGHPFDSTNKDDILILEQWKSKNTKFYDIAINTWTVRDVLKRETAKKNNLNYIEVFTNDVNEIKII